MRNRGIGGWLLGRARLTPDAVALRSGEREVRYGALVRRVARFAHGLHSLGVRRADRVAYVGGNDPSLVETLFACALLGAVFVPVNPGLPPDAVRRLLNATTCAVLVYGPGSAPSVRAIRPLTHVEPFVAVRDPDPGDVDLEGLLGSAPDDPPERAVDEGDLCLIHHTSGTTGASKGVMLSHGNLTATVVNLLACADYVSTDVMLVTAPLYRIGGLGTLLPVLFKGACAVILPRFEPGEVLAALARQRPTVLFNDARQLARLYHHPAFASADLSPVRVWMCGGDAIPRWVLAAWHERGIALQPCYGLTETGSLALALPPGFALAKSGSVGMAPPCTEARIADPSGEEVPRGVVGELWIRGPHVMQGYWDDPAATGRALRDGWLRTGDAARMDDDGCVWLLDRLADALPLNGDVVYPHQIEGVLRQHPEVAECAVVSCRSRLVAFVVPAERARPDPRDLAGMCADALPPELVPSEVRLAPDLPRNANGKLLRQEIRALLEAEIG